MGAASADERAQRRERVVADPAGPHEVPECLGQRAVVVGVDGIGELAEQERAATVERLDDRGLQGVGLRRSRAGGAQHEIGRVELDPAVVAGQRAGAGPHDLAGGGQLVEHRGGVVAYARRQHQRLPRRCRQRQTGQLVDRRQHTVGAAQAAAHALPRRQETGVGQRVDGLDLVTGGGERARAQTAQDAGLDPLGAGGLRPELALGQAAVAREPAQHLERHGAAEAEPGGGLLRRERPVGARVAGDQVGQRVGGDFEERLGDAHRHHDAERVAQATGVLDDGPAHLAGHRHLDGAPRLLQLAEPGLGVGRDIGLDAALPPRRS